MNSSTGFGLPLLYLDFDGVLHPSDVWHSPKGGASFGGAAQDEPHALFENANLLAELLEPYPEVGIVLSTSWVYTFGLLCISMKIPANLWNRVIGSTYRNSFQLSHFTSMPRGYQILEDVHRRRPHSWLALDDDTIDWPEEYIGNLVATDPVHGIAEESVYANLKRKLSRMVEHDD